MKHRTFLLRVIDKYPVVPGVALDPFLAKLGRGKEDTISVANYGANLAKAVQVMNWRWLEISYHLSVISLPVS
jgi:iron(III) transport system substrate-binding protein